MSRYRLLFPALQRGIQPTIVVRSVKSFIRVIFLLYRHDTHLLCLYAPLNLSQQWIRKWGVFMRDNVLLKVLKLFGQWKTILLWQGVPTILKKGCCLILSFHINFLMLLPLLYLSTYSWKLKHSSLCLCCFVFSPVRELGVPKGVNCFDYCTKANVIITAGM